MAEAITPPSDARYGDGAPFDEITYLEAKLILKPARFTAVKDFRAFGKIVKKTAKQTGVGFDPGIMRAAVDPLALVDEAPQRHPAVAIAEDDIEKDGDLLSVRLDVERINLRRRVVEVAPGIEGNDVVIAHAGRPQQRWPQGHIRHS